MKITFAFVVSLINIQIKRMAMSVFDYGEESFSVASEDIDPNDLK